MQEIVREALVMVDQNVEQEAVDPKAKGKGAKTPAETANEPSEELTAHKEIANLILSQV